MKKTSILILSFLVLSVSTLAQVPKETSLGVHDYTGTLTTEQIQELNEIIWQYERETSIEIGIAIITDDQYDHYGYASTAATEIGQLWGVGKKNVDNGLLIMNAPGKREIYLATGYWTEMVIPDGLAGQLIREHAVPHLKNGEIFAGLKALLVASIETMGKRSEEEIAYMIEQRKFKEQQAAELVAKVFLVLVCCTAIAVLLFIIGRKLSEAWSEYHRRGELKNRIRRRLDEISQLIGELEKVVQEGKIDSGCPGWARGKAMGLVSSFSTLKSELLAKVRLIEAGLKNPDSVAAEAANLDTQQLQSMAVDFEAIPKKISRYESQAPGKVGQLAPLVNSIAEEINRLKADGFQVQNLDSKLTNLQKEADEVKRFLNKEGYKTVCERADEITGQLKSLSETAQALRTKKRTINNQIQGFTAEIAEVRSRVKEADRLLAQLKQYPESAWKEENQNYQQIFALLLQAEKQITKAATLGSMESQQFDSALQALNKADQMIHSATIFQCAIGSKLNELADAQRQAEQLLGSARSKVQTASSKSSESDAGSDSKSTYRKAQVELTSAERAMDNGSINWILVLTALTAAIALAKKSISQAENNIEAAERARRIRRQSMYSSSYSSSSLSSSSSSFGGSFGGGSFGGGGAGCGY